jgi:RNA polymerase sigma-70 factor (ECF subfamily)
MMKRTADDILNELLVLRCQEGSVEAWRELVSRWQQRLFAHARHLTEQQEAARDVTQEAWLAMARSLRRLDDPALFRPWAYRIVTNKANDWLRRQQRERRMLDRTKEEMAGQTDQVPDDSGRQEESRDRVRRAVRQLHRDQRALLSMLYIEEMSLAEIAAALNIPVGTVKSRLHTTRHELKSILERDS